MAVYTNPDGTSSYDLRSNTLSDPTVVADIALSEKDAYAKILKVSNGGVVDNLTISAKGSALIYNGGSVNSLVISAVSGTPRIVVYDGGVVSNALTNGAVEFWASKGGLIDGATLRGNTYAILYNGGSMYNATISSAALFFICSSSLASNVTIRFNKVNSRNCLSGGTMLDCSVIGGGMYYVRNGSAVRTLVSSGTFHLSGGLTEDTVIHNAGSVVVSKAGATVNGTVVSGGVLNILDGAVNDTTILGGSANVSAGTVTGTIVEGAGVLHGRGGTIEGTTVNDGGIVNASTGATFTGATLVNGGVFNVSAGATLAGTPQVASGGVVNALTGATFETALAVNDGGTLNISAGATFTEAPVVNEGGFAHIYSGTNISNLTVAAGGDLGITVAPDTYIAWTSDGSAFVMENATLTDYSVAAPGGVYVLSGGNATGIDLAAGAALEIAVTGNTVAQGSYGGTAFEMTGASIDGFTVNARGALHVGADGTATNIKENGGFVGEAAGATVTFVENAFSDLVLDGTSATVHEKTSASNISIARNAALYVSGGKVDDVEMTGQDTYLYVAGGSVGGAVDVAAGGRIDLIDGTIDEVTFRGIDSTTDVLKAAGGTIGTLNVTGGGIQIAGDAVVEELNVARTDATKVWVSNGGTVNGGQTEGSFEFRMENGGGTIKDFTVGNGTYLFWSAGYASGVTIAQNAGKIRFYGSSTDALTIDDMTIYRKKDTSDNRGLVEGTMNNCRIMSGGYLVQSGGVNNNMLVAGTLEISAGEANNLHVSGLSANIIASNGEFSDVLIEDYGKFTVLEGATLIDPVVRMNSATAIKVGNNWQYARINVGTAGKAGGLVSGGRTEGGYTLEIYLQSGGVIRDMTYNEGAYVGLSATAVVSGGTFNGSTTLSVRGGRAENIVVSSGGAVTFQTQGGTVDGVRIESGARLYVSSGGSVSNATVLSGGSIFVYGNGAKAEGVAVDSGAFLRLNLSAAVEYDEETGEIVASRTEAYFDTLENVNAVVSMTRAVSDISYKLADTGNAALVMEADHEGFLVEVTAGSTKINPFGQQYTIDAEGTTLQVDAYALEAATEAKSLLDSSVLINGGDRAIKWDGVELTGGVAVTLADASINGNGWLELNSVNLDSKSVIYGASGDFGGTMNYLVRGSGGIIGNFAAGAETNGTVGGVKIVAYDADFDGVVYAGGFGNVGTMDGNDFVGGAVETVVSSGAQIARDFYAGALANYNKTHTRTAIGTVTTTIATSYVIPPEVEGDEPIVVNGRIGGNIYGASAVKAGTISTAATDAPLHTVGEVTLTLTGGEAEKSDFCAFAGGYATGADSAKLAAVYTVDSVIATVSGGIWGEGRGGRGIFSGIFASGVRAEVGEVNLTVSGGTMGNVYGGGWAQKDGESVVGDVNITIRGSAEVANVFGGGSHSISGGATSAGNVIITVSGGTITGAIYARGQFDGDAVGNAEVIFTGASDFDCGVYGYSYNSTDPIGSRATLSFSGYTGTFSGAIGGFAGVDFTGGTRMTLTTAADDVSNTAWNFDFSERSNSFAGTAALNWGEGVFGENSQLAVTFADAAQAQASWSIAAVADAAKATFGLTVGETVVASDLAYDTAIEGGAWDGWGFTLDEGVLKFKQLA